MMEQQERADRIRRQNMSACMRTAREFMCEEDAVGVVEIILILVVLISLVRSILSKITKQSNSI